MKELLGGYVNGNTIVRIYSDGTRVMETEDDEFAFQFPNSMDCKITNQCDQRCHWCHENSTPDGRHGDILNEAFIDTLRPHTEMAIGGGNVLSHPQLMPFLKKLKSKQVIANITVNQTHFMCDRDFLMGLTRWELIRGLGVSLQKPSDEFIRLIKGFDHAVVHVINGVVTMQDMERLMNQGLKLLILGYKQFRRGADWYGMYDRMIEPNKARLKEALPEIMAGFKVVSFDNLAVEQLAVKDVLSEKQWETFYNGSDGKQSGTMYVDMVERKFALSSTSNIRYDLTDSIEDMFRTVCSVSTY